MQLTLYTDLINFDTLRDMLWEQKSALICKQNILDKSVDQGKLPADDLNDMLVACQRNNHKAGKIVSSMF